MSGWRLIANFVGLTFCAMTLSLVAWRWWWLRKTDGQAIWNLSLMFVILAAVFDVFWLVRLNTIVQVIPVDVGYAILREYIWVLYIALGIAALRTQP